MDSFFDKEPFATGYNPNIYISILGLIFLYGVFRKLKTPAAPHPGQALLGAAVIYSFYQYIYDKNCYRYF